MQYEDIVESDELTCFACPVIYDGFLKDGTPFYFRLRHGGARLVLNDSDSLTQSMRAINDLDGVCSYEEYKQMFMELYSKF